MKVNGVGEGFDVEATELCRSDKAFSWKAKTALAVGVGVPLTLAATADTAAAEMSVTSIDEGFSFSSPDTTPSIGQGPFYEMGPESSTFDVSGDPVGQGYRVSSPADNYVEALDDGSTAPVVNYMRPAPTNADIFASFDFSGNQSDEPVYGSNDLIQAPIDPAAADLFTELALASDGSANPAKDLKYAQLADFEAVLLGDGLSGDQIHDKLALVKAEHAEQDAALPAVLALASYLPTALNGEPHYTADRAQEASILAIMSAEDAIKSNIEQQKQDGTYISSNYAIAEGDEFRSPADGTLYLTEQEAVDATILSNARMVAIDPHAEPALTWLDPAGNAEELAASWENGDKLGIGLAAGTVFFPAFKGVLPAFKLMTRNAAEASGLHKLAELIDRNRWNDYVKASGEFVTLHGEAMRILRAEGAVRGQEVGAVVVFGRFGSEIAESRRAQIMNNLETQTDRAVDCARACLDALGHYSDAAVGDSLDATSQKIRRHTGTLEQAMRGLQQITSQQRPQLIDAGQRR